MRLHPSRLRRTLTSLLAMLIRNEPDPRERALSKKPRPYDSVVLTLGLGCGLACGTALLLGGCERIPDEEEALWVDEGPGAPGGEEGQVNPPTDGPWFFTGEPVSYHRLSLERRPDGEVTLLSRAALVSAEPIWPGRGDHTAVAWRGSELHSARSFYFPTLRTVEIGGAGTVTDVETSRVSVLLPVDAQVSLVEVLDAGGEVVLEYDPAESPAPPRPRPAPPQERDEEVRDMAWCLSGELDGEPYPTAQTCCEKFWRWRDDLCSGSDTTYCSAWNTYSAQGEGLAEQTWGGSSSHIRMLRTLSQHDFSCSVGWVAGPTSAIDTAMRSIIDPLAPENAAMRQQIQQTLDELPPILRGSISEIGITSMMPLPCPDDPESISSSGVGGWVSGRNTLILSQRDDPEVLETNLVHEAAHTLHNTIDAPRRTVPPTFPANVLAELQRVQDLLIGGTRSGPRPLEKMWTQVQSTAVEMNLGFEDYGGEQAVTDVIAGGCGEEEEPGDGAAIVRAGFVNHYAQRNMEEDFASTVQYILADSPSEHPFCSFFAEQSRLEPEASLQLAKVAFLRALGLVDSSWFESCIAPVDPTADLSGIHLQTESGSVDFLQEARAGYTEVEGYEDEWYNFVVNAQNPDWLLGMNLILPFPSLDAGGQQQGWPSPVGFHQLSSDTWYYTFQTGEALAYLNFVGLTPRGSEFSSSADSAVSDGGFVLITPGESGSFRGYAFGFSLLSGDGALEVRIPVMAFDIDNEG